MPVYDWNFYRINILCEIFLNGTRSNIQSINQLLRSCPLLYTHVLPCYSVWPVVYCRNIATDFMYVKRKILRWHIFIYIIQTFHKKTIFYPLVCCYIFEFLSAGVSNLLIHDYLKFHLISHNNVPEIKAVIIPHLCQDCPIFHCKLNIRKEIDQMHFSQRFWIEFDIMILVNYHLLN